MPRAVRLVRVPPVAKRRLQSPLQRDWLQPLAFAPKHRNTRTKPKLKAISAQYCAFCSLCATLRLLRRIRHASGVPVRGTRFGRGMTWHSASVHQRCDELGRETPNALIGCGPL